MGGIPDGARQGRYFVFALLSNRCISEQDHYGEEDHYSEKGIRQ